MTSAPNIIDAKNRFLEKYVSDTMEKLRYEITLLQKWFKQDFPESRLEINVDLDKIKRGLTVQAKVLTGQEMVDNRGSFFNKLFIPEKYFMDGLFMTEFLRVFNEKYRAEISRSINLHYHKESAREAAKES